MWGNRYFTVVHQIPSLESEYSWFFSRRSITISPPFPLEMQGFPLFDLTPTFLEKVITKVTRLLLFSSPEIFQLEGMRYCRLQQTCQFAKQFIRGSRNISVTVGYHSVLKFEDGRLYRPPKRGECQYILQHLVLLPNSEWGCSNKFCSYLGVTENDNFCNLPKADLRCGLMSFTGQLRQ